MLTIGVEDKDPRELAIEPVTQPGPDRLALPAILRVNDHFRTGFARVRSSSIVRSIINYEDMIELLACPADNVTDMFFLVISRNDGGDRRAIRFVHRPRRHRRNVWAALPIFHCQRTTGWKSAA